MAHILFVVLNKYLYKQKQNSQIINSIELIVKLIFMKIIVIYIVNLKISLIIDNIKVEKLND